MSRRLTVAIQAWRAFRAAYSFGRYNALVQKVIHTPYLLGAARKPRPALWALRRAYARHAAYAVGAAIVVLALAYRFALVRTVLNTVDSDQAVLGIMARHILRGDHPVFFYGQAYQGALEAYLTAGVFGVWGQNDFTLRVVPALFSALLVAQLYALARRLYGQGVATAVGLWAAAPAPVLIYWGTVAGAGYAEAMSLGTGVMAVAVRRWGLGDPRRYDLPLLGFLTGLGVWTHPVIAYYLAALAVTHAARLWRLVRAAPPRAIVGPLAPALAPFIVGAAPWLGYTLLHGGGSLAVLSGRPSLAALPDALWRLYSETLPLLLGGAVPSTLSDEFVSYTDTHTLSYALAMLLFVYLAVRLAFSPGGLPAQLRALWRGYPLPDAPLALLPVVTTLFYLASRFEALSWTTHNPRYLLPVYTSMPYLCAVMAPLRTRSAARRRARRWADALALLRPRARALVLRHAPRARRALPWAPGLALALALSVNVYGTVQYAAPPRVTPLAAALLSRGDEAVYCLYWCAWRLAFESEERLIPVVTDGVAVDTRPVGNRYPPYLARAARARRWAYVLPYDRDTPALLALLARYRVPYAHWRWGDASVFDGPAWPGFPPGLVGGESHK